jgi:dolichol-phosphate mannosyltransferase
MAQRGEVENTKRYPTPPAGRSDDQSPAIPPFFEVILTPSPELSVVVPTFNERENIQELVHRLAETLQAIRWEVIFVDDDSPDGTAALVRSIAQRDPRVRIIHRIGRRGLSTACVEGMLASSAPFLAVMDADLQHDERILPAMLRAVKDDGYDIAVGSRYVAGGSLGEWGEERQFASQFATRLSRLVLKAGVKDPMSGFFLLKREVLEGVVADLSGIGFKIMLDIFASSTKPLRYIEIPYEFRIRQAGESKLDSAAVWDYLMMLLDKSLGRYIPIRFIPFALVGGAGVFVHLLVLWLVYDLAGYGFATGQTAAAVIAMTFNFFVNNAVTYRDRQLRGWGMLRGWLSFTLACSLGAVANVGIATYAFETQLVGETAWVLSAIAGIIVGAVWNYAVTSVYTWNKVKGA